MKKCKYCQTEINEKAKYCPNCQKKQGMGKIGKIILIILGLIIVASVFGTDSQENAQEGNITNSSTSNTNEKQKEKFTYEISNQYTDDYGISYYVEGVVKNNKDKDYSYVQIEFVCYDKEGNNLGTAIDNTNNLLGNQTWKFKAIAMFSGSEEVDHCDYHDITSW